MAQRLHIAVETVQPLPRSDKYREHVTPIRALVDEATKASLEALRRGKSNAAA